MDIKPTSYRYDGEGIECAYRNEKWDCLYQKLETE